MYINRYFSRLILLILLLVTIGGCSQTTRYPKTPAKEIILKFTVNGTPLRSESGNYSIGAARQITKYKTCHGLMGSWTCDTSIDVLYLSGDDGAGVIKVRAHGPLNDRGEIKVRVKSEGPIGDYPTTRCIEGKSYIFDSGDWIKGPFHDGQIININYTYSHLVKAKCPYSGASEITPSWWPKS